MPVFRRLKLERLETGPEDDSTANQEGRATPVEPEDITAPSSGVLRAITASLGPLAPTSEDVAVPAGEEGAHYLLKRTPNSYLLNQAYGLWVYVSLFLLTIVLTHSHHLTVADYGMYAVAATAFNTIAYVVALGLEDATTTFVPRIYSEHGQAAAASLVRRLLAIRLAVLGLSLGVLLFGLPLLSNFFAILPTPLAANIAAGLRSPGVTAEITPIAFWVLASGLFSLFNAVYAAIMRMNVVFIVGGLVQLGQLGLAFIALQLGWGITGVLWMMGSTTFVGALAFAIWLAPLIFTSGSEYRPPLQPVLRLGISAWFTNLVSGALLKQIAVLLLITYGATLTQQAYFNASFQLTDGANLLLVSGFGGVGVAALAAAFVGLNYGRLSRIWQTLLKVETLLSAPGLIFCLFNAQNIMVALYGTRYAPAGQLFAIFLALNLTTRLLGYTVHQSTLFVVNKAQWVVTAQWIGLGTVLGLGFWLVPQWGPAGALVADGVARLVASSLMLLFLWRDLPEKFPLSYVARVVLATVLAASPALIIHADSKPLLAVMGVLYILLTVALLTVLKPLSKKDLDMIAEVKPAFAPYLRWFARNAEKEG